MESLAADPSRQAFLLLRTVFTVAPIVFGLDKFANALTDWPAYLAPLVNDIVPGTAQQAMYAVGVVEILAGVAVAVLPRYGALLVAAWLAGIIVNLLLDPRLLRHRPARLRPAGRRTGAVPGSRCTKTAARPGSRSTAAVHSRSGVRHSERDSGYGSSADAANPTSHAARRAIADLLTALGRDPTDPHLAETPSPSCRRLRRATHPASVRPDDLPER